MDHFLLKDFYSLMVSFPILISISYNKISEITENYLSSFIRRINLIDNIEVLLLKILLIFTIFTIYSIYYKISMINSSILEGSIKK